MKQGPHDRPLRSAEFRFYEELNDFLPAARRKVAFMQTFHGTPAVRDVIQAIGVPHTAVDLVLVDGRSVGFTHRLRGGERVAVYPVFERLDIGPLLRLRPRPLRRTRFVLDVHLGRLARYLRMLGFDCAYGTDWDDLMIVGCARSERRIILTRDIGILKQKRVSHGYWLRSADPREQVAEVIDALDLRRQMKPFSRCMDCNGPIETADAAAVGGRIDPDIRRRFDAFWQCADCGKVYWRGSHYRRMLQLVRAFAARGGPESGDADR